MYVVLVYLPGLQLANLPCSNSCNSLLVLVSPLKVCHSIYSLSIERYHYKNTIFANILFATKSILEGASRNGLLQAQFPEFVS